jgi:hypothetical protein
MILAVMDYSVIRRHGSKIIILSLVLSTLLWIGGFAQAGENHYAPSDAYELIDAVNQLRAANGLVAYQVDSTLMGIAQAHSDYQASIGDVTHTGPGGTRPVDRARAAGYGGGAQIFISENIAGGLNLSASTAVDWWQGDAPHLNTMLGANYVDVGAGVGVSGKTVYYTLDVGYSAGGSGNAAPPAQGGTTPGPTFISPVLTSTPLADGTIVHIVEYGQALISIATAYGVTVNEIKALNQLTGDQIYVGQRLIIRLGHTATMTLPVSPTITRTPIPTRTATSTPTVRSATRTPTPPGATLTSTPARGSSLPSLASIVKDPFLIVIIVLTVSGGVMMLVGSILKRLR